MISLLCSQEQCFIFHFFSLFIGFGKMNLCDPSTNLFYCTQYRGISIVIFSGTEIRFLYFSLKNKNCVLPFLFLLEDQLVKDNWQI